MRLQLPSIFHEPLGFRPWNFNSKSNCKNPIGLYNNREILTIQLWNYKYNFFDWTFKYIHAIWTDDKKNQYFFWRPIKDKP